MIPSKEDLPRGDLPRPALDMRIRAGDILQSRPSVLVLGDLLAVAEGSCEIPRDSTGFRDGWSFL